MNNASCRAAKTRSGNDARFQNGGKSFGRSTVNIRLAVGLGRAAL